MSWVSDAWGFYKANRDILTPLLTPLGTILVGLGTFAVGIGAMRVSRQQAMTAAQQSVTTAFHNAVSRLASDKIEERLGGIYILERVARDSLNDHWPVMETLTAFVRAQATWKPATAPTPEPQTFEQLDNVPFPEPTAIVAAALTVIGRRSEAGRRLEQRRGRVLDLRRTDLRGAFLTGAHLEGADLSFAHLEGADLSFAHLETTRLLRAHLEGAFLTRAYLEGALLLGAHLQRTSLEHAHLEGAILTGAQLQRAHLAGAHLRGAYLFGAYLSDEITKDQISEALGDASTQLPTTLTRPTHWPNSFARPPDPDRRADEARRAMGRWARLRAAWRGDR